MPPTGHTVVLGTAGSGKTTLAILRADYLANPIADHAGRTLLVTYNNALVTFMKGLHRSSGRVQTETYHKFARGYLNSRGLIEPRGSIVKTGTRHSLIEAAVAERIAAGDSASVLTRGTRFLGEEFKWLAQHQITSEKDYGDADRVGRAGTRVVKASRPSVWRAYQGYLARRAADGFQYDWDDMAHAVLNELTRDTSTRRYRHVIIDEGQDFSPVMLRSLAAAIPDDGSLTFFGDMAQQIYGNRMSWKSAGLSVSHGTWKFQENYRNTREIARLALAVAKMPYFSGYPDLVEPKDPVAGGPKPILRKMSSGNERDELAWVVSQAQRLSEQGTVAILLRDRSTEWNMLKPLLPPGAVRLHKDLRGWPTGPGLFYGMYHSAKGLEFDTVFLPFCSADRLPHPPEVAAFGKDALSSDGRLLYVGITRARTGLVISYCGKPSPLLPPHADLYLVGTV